MQKPFNVIFVSRSGAGKGTQIELIKKNFPGLISISTGDLMRDLASQQTQAGLKIKSVLNEGGLPFDDMATTLWMHEIAYVLKEEQGLICDGFPRRLNESHNLDLFLEWLERIDRTIILLLDISRETAFKRLKLRGRSDDLDEQINHRLDYYEESVVPVIEFYRSQNRLFVINGEPSVEEVFQQIKDAINDFNKN